MGTQKLTPKMKNTFLQLFNIFLHKMYIRSHEFTQKFTPKMKKHIFTTF